MGMLQPYFQHALVTGDVLVDGISDDDLVRIGISEPLQRKAVMGAIRKLLMKYRLKNEIHTLVSNVLMFLYLQADVVSATMFPSSKSLPVDANHCNGLAS